jgi:hypothetical protein
MRILAAISPACVSAFAQQANDGMPVPVNVRVQVNFRLVGGPKSLSRAVFDRPEGVARPVQDGQPASIKGTSDFTKGQPK